MKQFLLTMAGVFAGLVLFFIGVPFLLIALVASSARPNPPPAVTVLTLDLRPPLTDQESQNPLAGFGARSNSVLGVIQALHRAQTDARVKGLLIRLPEGGLEPAAADEIRLAVKAFRATGKRVIAHSQGIYASGISTTTYMVGASANEFWMQPSSSLQATGVASEDIFFKRLFDKYGVVADYQQRYEYKNAVNPFLYSDYTPAHREASLSWMGSVYTSDVGQAAADRTTVPAALGRLLEAGPYSAEDAQAKGLIDHVGQEHEAEQALLARAGSGAVLLDLNDYRRRGGGPTAASSGPAVALIGAEGEIVTGTGDNTGLAQSTSIYSDDLAKAFYDAAKDNDVKAIVFRISSPGGSDTASEQILAGVRAAKAAKKPVVVSMGTYAASGGYWIASQADEIVAEPTTLTGSIGVFGGKFALGDALARFGVDVRALSVGGDFAAANGMGKPFSPTQKAAINAWMDRIYDAFVARVATGRKLTPDRVKEIAKGRVWTGAQGVQLGLVDKTGGFYLAVDEAKRLGKLGTGPVRLKLLPVKKSPFDALSRMAGLSTEGVRVLAAAGWILGDPRAKALMDEMAQTRLPANGSMVLAPMSLH